MVPPLKVSHAGCSRWRCALPALVPCFRVNKAEYMIIIMYKMKTTAVETAVAETFPFGNVAKIAWDIERVKRAAGVR
jgi:hypothetical protein